MTKLRLMILLGWLWGCLGSVSVLALSLEEAKSKGLVGEKADGYLGVVNATDAEAHAVVKEINLKRQQAYDEIAKRNGTAMSAVEALAGEKAIQNTRAGHYVQSPTGWTKK
jgi:hypothetical protein